MPWGEVGKNQASLRALLNSYGGEPLDDFFDGRWSGGRKGS